MKFRFIKTPSNRKFNLEPVYYDEAKEQRIERERRIREEMGLPVDGSNVEESKTNFKDRIRGSMRPKIRTRFEAGEKQKQTSNIRLVVILILLAALFYYLLNAGYDWYSKFL